MLTWLASFLGSGIPKVIVDGLNEAHRERLQAQNNTQRLAAERQIAILEASTETIKNAQKDKYERWVRIGFAFPFIVYNMKLVIWDKVLGAGVTDPLSPELAQIQTVIIISYFGYAAVSRLKR